MKKLNDNFENRWKEKFEDAEAAPQVSVWDRIDASMAGSEIRRYKKKLFYYQITAAASILLALLFGSYSLYNLISTQETEQLATTPAAVIENDDKKADSRDIQEESVGGLMDMEEESNSRLSDIDQVASETNLRRGNPNSTIQSGNLLNKETIEDNSGSVLAYLTSNQGSKQENPEKQLVSDGGYLNNYDVLSYHPVSSFQVPYEKPGRKFYLEKKVNPFDEPYLVPLEIEEQDEDPSKLWAGIMVSSGVFDPNINYNGSSNVMADATPNTLGSVERIDAASADHQSQSNFLASYKPEESGYNSDMSVSYGLDFGYKFSKKFVLFSGVGYQHNFGSTSVNTYIEPTESHAKYANHAIVIERASPESGLDSYNELNSEVRLNSTFEFVTIPVNFGYFLVDKKFKWLMTAGVSTDIFIKNSIEDSQNLFDPVQYKLGDDSPYNPVYFNGRFGTMVNYTFLKNYQISLEPSYRVGLNELTSNTSSFSSRPSSFMISAGIAYVFK